MKRTVVATAVAVSLVFGMGACGKGTHTSTKSASRVECDKGDQKEHADDCGYFKGSRWVWYSWVVPGKTSYAPKGFHKQRYHQ